MVIIAAADRSDRAKRVVAEAAELSEAFDEPLHVVHVLSRSDFVQLEQTAYDEVGTALPMDDVEEIAEEFARDAASDITGEFEAVGLMGDAAEAVIDYADKTDARYIVVGGRKRSPAGKVIFGSVTQSILLNAERPVVSFIAD